MRDIVELVDTVRKYLDGFRETAAANEGSDEWDELCTQTLLESEELGLVDLDKYSSREQSEVIDNAASDVYLVLYALTSDDDPCFSKWRSEFRNEFH
jgi:hypothetical protein